MWVKICGITRHDDAALAAGLGADALGFVFTLSPRRVSRGDVLPWIRGIAGVEKVAVFRNEGAEDIIALCDGLGIDTVQIHAQPSRSHEALLGHYGIIYAMKEYCPELVPAFPCRILIDASTGKGLTGEWIPRETPYILAGGLTPDNVREAIRKGRPAGVDVSTGVEIAPGIKDPLKVDRFIREVRQCEQ